MSAAAASRVSKRSFYEVYALFIDSSMALSIDTVLRIHLPDHRNVEYCRVQYYSDLDYLHRHLASPILRPVKWTRSAAIEKV